jgi:hypothetical protein
LRHILEEIDVWNLYLKSLKIVIYVGKKEDKWLKPI